MSLSVGRIWRQAVSALALAAACAFGYFAAIPPVHEWVFHPSVIAPEEGRAYVAPVDYPQGIFFVLLSDGPERPEASRLRMFENGQAIGPAHSQHADIRTNSSGAFSHWEGHVVFSATDGSDPRFNGRRYTAESRPTLRKEWRGLALALLVLAAIVNAPMILDALMRGVSNCIERSRAADWRALGRSRLLLNWLFACSTGIAFCVLLAALQAPTVALPLDLSQASRDKAAVVAPLSLAPTTLYRLVDDDPEAPRASQMRVYEDDRPLGPPHSAHEKVRMEGRGAFSHWNGHLFFSTSDNSDPRVNGRHYRVEGPLSLRLPWLALGWGAAILAAVLGLARLHVAGRLGPLTRFTRGVTSATAAAARPQVREATNVALVTTLLAIAASVVLVFAGWLGGDATTSGAEIARYLPVSDALGYHSCAISIAAFGELNQSFGGEWCSRRILYTTLLSSLLMATGSDSSLVLLFQGALAGTAAAVFVIRVARYVGLAGAAATALILFAYMWEFVLGLFLTEVAGFSLSLFGLVLLVSFAESKRPLELFAGCALFGVAMVSRAGALFALPAVALWAWVFVSARPNFRSWTLFAVSIAGLAVGAVLQVGVVWMIGSDPSNTGGNYAASLYSLSIGTRDWTHAYRDFSSLFLTGEKAAFEHIYRVAFQNIAAKPDVFLAALAGAEVEYLRSIFRFGFFESANPVMSAAAALGVLACILQFRTPVARLLLLLSAAEVVSAPLIFDSGGVRIFGSTIFIRAALCGAGVQLVLLSVLGARNRLDWNVRACRTFTGPLAACVGVAMVFAMVASATPLNRLTREPHFSNMGCPNGLVEVVARIGRESQMLTFTPRPTMLESVQPFRIGRERFAHDERMRGSAFGESIIGIERPLTILRAVDLGRDSRDGRIKTLAYLGELEPSDVPRSLCVDPAQHVRFVSYEHTLIRSVRALPTADLRR